MSVVEIAERIGVTEKRMRALVKEILARRMPAAPEDFAALQVSRLNEALLVAYGAMSAENLQAVALVVRIVRELDRYHGFVAAGRRARRDPGRSKPEVGSRSRSRRRRRRQRRERTSAGPPALAGRGAGAPPHPPRAANGGGPGRRGAFAAPGRPVDRPEMAPQALEKMESAPDKSALPHAFEAAPPAAEPARSVQADGLEAGPPNDALPPAAEPPQCDPRARSVRRRRANGAASG